jgi:serine protease inhibitor
MPRWPIAANERHAPAETRRLSAGACALLMLGLALGVIGCGNDDGIAPSVELPRQLTVGEQAVVRNANAFGFDLFKAVYAADPNPNVFLSPLSASMALGMTANGAAGETWEGMRRALRFEGISETEINESYRGLMDLLLDLDPRVTVRIGNSVWSKQGIPFEPAFYDAVKNFFNAEANELDFANPSSVDVINGWARDATNGRIQKVIETIEPEHIMFLMNALYFKGKWAGQFKASDTRPRPFTLANGSRVDVPTMVRPSAHLMRTATSEYQAFELAYGGNAFAMTVVLPAPGRTLSQLVTSLDGSAWDALVAGLDSAKLEVQMPRFRYEYETFLNQPLAGMGMETAFSGRADFTRLTPLDGVCIHFVKQNTFVEVNEEGTEAAAVTTVGMGVTSAPMPIVVDRPFLFVIRERHSGTILFTGAIGDPLATQSAKAQMPPIGC